MSYWPLLLFVLLCVSELISGAKPSQAQLSRRPCADRFPEKCHDYAYLCQAHFFDARSCAETCGLCDGRGGWKDEKDALRAAKDRKDSRRRTRVTRVTTARPLRRRTTRPRPNRQRPSRPRPTSVAPNRTGGSLKRRNNERRQRSRLWRRRQLLRQQRLFGRGSQSTRSQTTSAPTPTSTSTSAPTSTTSNVATTTTLRTSTTEIVTTSLLEENKRDTTAAVLPTTRRRHVPFWRRWLATTITATASSTQRPPRNWNILPPRRWLSQHGEEEVPKRPVEKELDGKEESEDDKLAVTAGPSFTTNIVSFRPQLSAQVEMAFHPLTTTAATTLPPQTELPTLPRVRPSGGPSLSSSPQSERISGGGAGSSLGFQPPKALPPPTHSTATTSPEPASVIDAFPDRLIVGSVGGASVRSAPWPLPRRTELRMGNIRKPPPQPPSSLGFQPPPLSQVSGRERSQSHSLPLPTDSPAAQRARLEPTLVAALYGVPPSGIPASSSSQPPPITPQPPLQHARLQPALRAALAGVPPSSLPTSTSISGGARNSGSRGGAEKAEALLHLRPTLAAALAGVPPDSLPTAPTVRVRTTSSGRRHSATRTDTLLLTPASKSSVGALEASRSVTDLGPVSVVTETSRRPSSSLSPKLLTHTTRVLGRNPSTGLPFEATIAKSVNGDFSVALTKSPPISPQPTRFSGELLPSSLDGPRLGLEEEEDPEERSRPIRLLPIPDETSYSHPLHEPRISDYQDPTLIDWSAPSRKIKLKVVNRPTSRSKGRWRQRNTLATDRRRHPVAFRVKEKMAAVTAAEDLSTSEPTPKFILTTSTPTSLLNSVTTTNSTPAEKEPQRGPILPLLLPRPIRVHTDRNPLSTSRIPPLLRKEPEIEVERKLRRGGPAPVESSEPLPSALRIPSLPPKSFGEFLPVTQEPKYSAEKELPSTRESSIPPSESPLH